MFKKIMSVWLRSKFICSRLSLPTFISCSWTQITTGLASRIVLNINMCHICLWSLHTNHYVWQLIITLLTFWISHLSIQETLRCKVLIFRRQSCHALVFRELEEILLLCTIKPLKESTWVLLLFLLHDLLSNCWSLMNSFSYWWVCSY